MDFALIFIRLLFTVLSWAIIIRIIFSWVRVDPYHPVWGPILNALYQITEPILAPARRLIPPMGGMDFSPIIVLVLFNLIETFLLRMLR